MHRPLWPFILMMIVFFLMSVDARIIGSVVCVPTGILMLSQCRKSKAEDSEQSEALSFFGGAIMVFFGICVMLSYLFR
ncbi:MAG: hypothetical protein IJ642_04230 [Oscillospiraceae bacterium]|nr:hypothetical protein [Oscillospiraceae bacterium]